MHKCICCGKDVWRIVHKLPFFLFKHKSEIYECVNCGLGKTLPEPSITLGFYVDNIKYDTLFIENEEIYKEFAASLLGLLGNGQSVQKTSLLDIGCGGGFLVKAANDLGYSATGIDANKGMVEWARLRGIPVEQGDIEQKLSLNKKYDVIVLSAILEHLFHPETLLNQCKKILKPGGRILVSQASYDGLLPKVFPWGWYGWQPQEHFWHFTPNSFEKIALSCGLNVKRLERNSLYHRYYLTGGLKNIFGRNLATFIARLGDKARKGDNFNCILVCNKQSGEC